MPVSRGQQRVVAVALCEQGNVLAIGYNSYVKTHPHQAACAKRVGKPLKEYLHAEVAAIVASRKPVHTLRVVRINKQNKLVAAKPCVICQEAIRLANIVVVEHS